MTGDDRIQVDWPKAEELLKDFAIGSALSAASNLATGQFATQPEQNAPTQQAAQDDAFARMVAEEVNARQAAQEAAQQASTPTDAGIAPDAENAPSGVFNTAQDAQETKPTQTVADIYANRATRQQNIDNAAQAADISSPTPVDAAASETNQPVSGVSEMDTHVADDSVTQEGQAVNHDGRDMDEGGVSLEDSTGAAPAGFDPVSQWQMEADAYHPVNEAAAQTTMEERGRAPMDIPTTDWNGRQVSKLVS